MLQGKEETSTSGSDDAGQWHGRASGSRGAFAGNGGTAVAGAASGNCNG